MTAKFFLLLACASLLGCDRQPELAKADHQVLCNPTSGEAFFVRPGNGDTSFVRRTPSVDQLCKQ